MRTTIGVAGREIPWGGLAAGMLGEMVVLIMQVVVELQVVELGWQTGNLLCNKRFLEEVCLAHYTFMLG